MDIRYGENSGSWLKEVILAAQDEAFGANWVKNNIDKEDVSSKCIMRGEGIRPLLMSYLNAKN